MATGAIFSSPRVVEKGQIVTAAGVSAGIDMASRTPRAARRAVFRGCASSAIIGEG